VQRAEVPIGRGVTDGANLFRDWFASLASAAESGEPAAYVFVMGSLAELLRTFDFHLVFPEINSLQTAIRHQAHEYLNEAEDYGYSPDICGYVKADVAMQLRGGRHPMGQIPRPALAVTTNACNTYLKWAEIWERLYGIPAMVVDVPGTRQSGATSAPGDPAFARDAAYVLQQIRELVAVCERVSGRPFDIDRLRDTMALTNRMVRAFRQIVGLNRRVPAPFNAVTEGTVFLGVANGFRGTRQGADYFDALLDELSGKAAVRRGTVDEERHRLAFAGVPCYPIFRRFNDMFAAHGGVFVQSTYLQFASGGADLAWEYDLSRPLESLAEGLLIGTRHAMDCMFFNERAIGSALEPYGIDGVVYHAVKSCRTVSTGLADGRRALCAEHDVGTLFIESDMMDRRVVSEAQLKNRIDAFFEGLEARRRGR
jgi:benzoyl-CoA reductase subunit B